jgi:hypothetical protein
LSTKDCGFVTRQFAWQVRGSWRRACPMRQPSAAFKDHSRGQGHRASRLSGSQRPGHGRPELDKATTLDTFEKAKPTICLVG